MQAVTATTEGHFVSIYDTAVTSGAVIYWLVEEEERGKDVLGDSAGRDESFLIKCFACFLDILIITGYDALKVVVFVHVDNAARAQEWRHHTHLSLLPNKDIQIGSFV